MAVASRGQRSILGLGVLEREGSLLRSGSIELEAKNNGRQTVTLSHPSCQRIQPYWETKIKINWGAPLTIATDLKCLGTSCMLYLASIKIRTDNFGPDFSTEPAILIGKNL